LSRFDFSFAFLEIVDSKESQGLFIATDGVITQHHPFEACLEIFSLIAGIGA